jgi:SAM-dependent methyltransferase
MVYNPLALYGFERAARRNAPIVARAIREFFPIAKSCIDVGCGTGRYVEDLQKTGICTVGVEFSPRLRRKCRLRRVEVFPFDLNVPTPHPPNAPYCLAMSLEVAEHISPVLADTFVRYFENLAEAIIFTAAQPGQGGTGHINEQPREYWISKFASIGFRLEEALTVAFANRLRHDGAFPYLYKNLSIFRKSAGPKASR